MSDLPERRRTRSSRGKPLTKRRKHPIIANQASLNDLTDDILIKLMCTLDIDTLFILSSVNKRVNGIFRSPWFFRQCIENRISPAQSRAALVRGHKIDFKHVKEGDVEYYMMTAEGETIDGVKYTVEWSVGVHEYADDLYDNYDPEEDAENYGNPPEDDNERFQWFRAQFDGVQDRVRGDVVFEFPQESRGVNFVRDRVKDILTYFAVKFVEYLATSDANIRTGGAEDSWYFGVEVRPFGIDIAAEGYDGKSTIKSVYEQMEPEHVEKKKTESPKREKGPRSSVSSNIAYSAREVELALNQVETNPRESDDPRLEKMCKNTVEEARKLLESIRLGESNDESTIDSLNRVHSRLLECIEM